MALLRLVRRLVPVGSVFNLGLTHGLMRKIWVTKLLQGLLAVGSSGFLGEGFMQGTSKYFYLPEAHTDFALLCGLKKWGSLAVFVVILVAAFTSTMDSELPIRPVMNLVNG